MEYINLAGYKDQKYRPNCGPILFEFNHTLHFFTYYLLVTLCIVLLHFQCTIPDIPDLAIVVSLLWEFYFLSKTTIDDRDTILRQL